MVRLSVYDTAHDSFTSYPPFPVRWPFCPPVYNASRNSFTFLAYSPSRWSFYPPPNDSFPCLPFVPCSTLRLSVNSAVQAENQEAASLKRGTSEKGGKASKTTAVCPGETRPRPLGRHSHATVYVESITESLHALFVFGGRETEDDLPPLGDLW